MPQQQTVNTNGTSFAQQPVVAATTKSASSKVANKYGDGFMTSSSHPQLAEQYGNVGTR
jgi:hypothetical protein